MKNIKLTVLSLMAVVGIAVAVPAYVSAGSAQESARQGLTAVNDGSNTDLTGSFRAITNTILYILGALAVIMIIVGGVRYVTSTGDSSRVTAAKNTIMYAVAGLVVALLAFAIVNFVLTNIR